MGTWGRTCPPSKRTNVPWSPGRSILRSFFRFYFSFNFGLVLESVQVSPTFLNRSGPSIQTVNHSFYSTCICQTFVCLKFERVGLDRRFQVFGDHLKGLFFAQNPFSRSNMLKSFILRRTLTTIKFLIHIFGTCLRGLGSFGSILDRFWGHLWEVFGKFSERFLGHVLWPYID